MKKSLHPYSVIFGLSIGFLVLVALRHPVFALVAGIASVVLIDMGLKNRKDPK